MRGFFLSVVLLAALAAPALAQDPRTNANAEDPTASRATTFQPVQGPARESVPGGALLVSAYALVWLFVLAYVARIGVLAAKTTREVAELEKQIRVPRTTTSKSE